MHAVSRIVLMVWVICAVTALRGEGTQGQVSGGALVASLRQGGYVLVMRHASSPRETPDKQTAKPDNVKLERQLDEAGRADSIAMGKALRDLKIPVGDVLSSPTYRAMETVRFAQLPNPKSYVELGDGGQNMQTVTEAQGAWLRQRATQLPKTGTNTIIVTHLPNLQRAFSEWGTVADGEMVVVGSDGKGGVMPVGRIKIEEWPRLH
jgi:phosphohistidine phosphatase SixA